MQREGRGGWLALIKGEEMGLPIRYGHRHGTLKVLRAVSNERRPHLGRGKSG